MVFGLFWNTISITSILPSGDSLGATPGLKTNNMVNLNNFSPIKPIIEFKKSLNRVHQDLKLCIRKQPPRGDSS